MRRWRCDGVHPSGFETRDSIREERERKAAPSGGDWRGRGGEGDLKRVGSDGLNLATGSTVTAGGLTS